MDKYLRILRAIRSGKDVSKEDLAYFVGHHQSFDEGSYEKLKTKLASEEGLKSMTDEDFDNYIEETKKSLSSDTYKEKVLDIAKEAKAGKVGENVARGLNLALAGTDIGISLSQINKSNQQLNTLKRPARPPILQRDAMLQQALVDAKGGTMDASRAVAPAQLGILDQYQSDLANAKTASAGQAGAYGAYAQEAANRRNRANLELAPMVDNIRNREQNRYDNLLGQRLQESQAINQSQNANYGNDLYQYGVDRQSANELGSVGRANLRDSLTGFAAQIPGIAAQRTRNKYDNIYHQMSVYGDDHAKTAVDAQRDLDNIHSFTPVDYDQSYFGKQA